MTALDLARKWAAPTPVLVVDDDAAFRIAFRDMAKPYGLDVVEAGTVDEARQALACHDFRAAFVDLLLGGETALDLLPAMPQGLPIVLITGHPDSPYLAQALDHGPFTVLRKPTDFQPRRFEQTLQFLNLRHLKKTQPIYREPSAFIRP